VKRGRKVPKAKREVILILFVADPTRTDEICLVLILRSYRGRKKEERDFPHSIAKSKVKRKKEPETVGNEEGTSLKSSGQNEKGKPSCLFSL